MGRPSKLSKEVAEKLVTAMKAGLPRVIACEMAGISKETLRTWLQNKKNAELVASIEAASAIGKASLYTELRALARDPKVSPDVRARTLQWILERIDRENFGYKATLAVEKLPPGDVTPQKAAEIMRNEFGSVGPNVTTEAPQEPGESLH